MMAIFRKAFRDSRRSTFWLAVGFMLYLMMILAFYPTFKNEGQEFQELIESYPEELLAMFYGGDTADLDISEPGTFIQTEFGSYGVVILGAIVIGGAFNAITNAERDGTLDMMLSLPVSRRRYLLGRALSTAVSMLLVLAACLLGFYLSMQIWPEFDVSRVNLALSMVGAFLYLMVVAGLAYLLAAIVPSSRRFAGAIAYLVLIGSFLLYGFSSLVDALEKIRPLLLNHYFNMGEIIREGPQLGDWLVMALIAAVYFGLAWWLIDRKELGV